MGGLAGAVTGGGGGASLQASSSASAGPSSSGNLSGPVFNFGGINSGTQDIPLSGGSASGDPHQPATVGTLPTDQYGGISVSSNTLIWVGVAAVGVLVLWALIKR